MEHGRRRFGSRRTFTRGSGLRRARRAGIKDDREGGNGIIRGHLNPSSLAGWKNIFSPAFTPVRRHSETPIGKIGQKCHQRIVLSRGDDVEGAALARGKMEL